MSDTGAVQSSRRPSIAPLTWAVFSLAVAGCASLTAIGADSRWLAALGGVIVRTKTIPAGVPFAAAPSSGWHNVPVLAELVFHALEAGLGDRGLVLAQILAVAVALGLVAREIVAEPAPAAVSALVLLLVPVAAASAFLVVRVQLFSLALFPLVVLLLRAQARAPSRWIWLLVPLTALWSNLHGAVLVGLAVAACYLLIDRRRSDPVGAVAVLIASAAATFATPAGAGTGSYYLGVLSNAAASAHEGLWARPSLRHPLDLLFLVAVLPLLVAAMRGRPRLWEWVAGAGLALSVATAARNEVWLVLFLAPAAVCGLSRTRTRVRTIAPAFAAVPTLAAAALLVLAVVRSPAQTGAGPALRRQAIAAAAGTPILADPYDAEQFALQGARIVISNPIDAFDGNDQRLYLKWIQGSRVAAEKLAPTARVVVVQRGTPAEGGLAGNPAFCKAVADRRSVLYVRRDAVAMETGEPLAAFRDREAQPRSGASSRDGGCAVSTASTQEK